MRINLNDSIEDIPLGDIRELMRKFFPKGDEHCLEALAERLGVSIETAERLMAALEARSWIMRTEHGASAIWERTDRGGQLALASARKPIKRKTADRLLAELVTRIRAVNAEDYFLFRVNKAIVFGSYLSDADQLGDLDVYLEIAPRDSNRRRHLERCQQRNEELYDQGVNIPSTEMYLLVEAYPRYEMTRVVRGRSVAIQLHGELDERFVLERPHRVVYDAAEDGQCSMA